MALFKIIESESINGSKEPNLRSIFKIELIKGELNEGDIIRLYETHHPIDFEIKKIEINAIYTSKAIPWNNWNHGTIVDTENIKLAMKRRS